MAGHWSIAPLSILFVALNLARLACLGGVLPRLKTPGLSAAVFGLDVGRLCARDSERTNFLPKFRGSNDFALSPPRKNPRHDFLQ